MPLRLLVALAIGGVALAIGLNYVYDYGVALNKHLKIEEFNPEVIYDGRENKIHFKIMDQSENPVKNANVMIIPEYDGDKVISGKTEENGEVTLYFTPSLPKDQYEGYLTIYVIANDYPHYEARNLIKVVRK
ncbi:MAG: hypothetical protein J7K61_05720 [Thermoplasmata archaeon]|nr:hypothetical protein [Thermoplasmata archaeon]